MVSLINYFEKLDSIGVDTLPPTLLKSHNFLVKTTNNGSDWGMYESNDSIKNALDLYIAKLNEYLSTHGERKKESEETKTAHHRKIVSVKSPKSSHKKTSSSKSSMTKKVKEFLTPFPPRLHFPENLTDPEISDYQFVIFDSVNDFGMTVNDFKKIRKDNPDTAFIFILQHTKGGKFKGGKDWEHLAEVVGEVVKGVLMTTKNRYHHRSLMRFLDDFKSEGSLGASPKPYPVTEY